MLCGVAQAQNADAKAGDAAAELAKELANPIANLISIPLQYNYDQDIGPIGDGSRSLLNIQPVIPVTLNERWNLITRTIVPLMDLQDIRVQGDRTSGAGDILASQFLSPIAPTASGWIWGAGLVENLPTASDDQLGSGKWGLGPTFVALKQVGPVTYGMLANHVWSVAGDSHRDAVSSTFVQPFFAYIAKTKTTFSLNTETSYDWQHSSWSVPLNASVAQLLKVGPQVMQITVGARYWAVWPSNGPSGWGVRVVLTLLYPK
jgi:hypothetical protein